MKMNNKPNSSEIPNGSNSEGMSEKEKAWKSAVKEQYKNYPVSADFSVGFDAGEKAERERVKKIMESFIRDPLISAYMAKIFPDEQRQSDL